MLPPTPDVQWSTVAEASKMVTARSAKSTWLALSLDVRACACTTLLLSPAYTQMRRWLLPLPRFDVGAERGVSGY